MVKSFLTLLSLISIIWINRVSTQASNNFAQLDDLDNALNLYDHDNSLDYPISSQPAVTKHGVYNSKDKITDAIPIPHDKTYQWIRKALLRFKKKAYRLTTRLAGNLTIVEDLKKAIKQARNCLLESSKDLPKNVKNNLWYCVNNRMEEGIEMVEDIVREMETILDVMEKLFKGVSECKGGRCLMKLSSNLGKHGVPLLFHVIKTVFHSMLLLASVSIQVPTCFSEALAVRPSMELAADFLECFI